MMRYLAPHENTSRGTSDFPLELYYVDMMHPRYEMPFHWHMEYELLLVLQGEFTLLTDGKSYTLHPGDAAFLSSGAVHGGVPRECIYECLVFDLNHLIKNYGNLFQQKYAELFAPETQINVPHPADTPCGHLIFGIFAEMKGRKTGYEFSTVGMLWQLLGQLLREHLYTVTPPSARHSVQDSSQIKQVLDYIRKNYASQLSLSDLAEVLQISPEHFCRVFHSVTGKSPMDYLNYYRVECACELLCTSSDSITEIAYSCGFHDLSYFNRIFRRYKSISPGSYRRQYNEATLSLRSTKSSR